MPETPVEQEKPQRQSKKAQAEAEPEVEFPGRVPVQERVDPEQPKQDPKSDNS